jgi:hypothetical protein
VAGVKYFPVPTPYDGKLLIGIYLHNDIFGPDWLTAAERITIIVLLHILTRKLIRCMANVPITGASLITGGDTITVS